MRTARVALAAFLLTLTVQAQESPNFRLTDYTFGATPQPALDSPSYRATLVSVGAAR